VIFIKTKKEIDLIRESCKIVAESLQLMKSNIKPGITTLELDEIAEDYIRSNNAIPAFKGYSQGGAPGFPGSVCISVAKEGNKVHDISASVQKMVENNDFSIVRDLCGHGVGKYLHEEPSIPNFGRRGTGAKLRNGMTLAIEPMVNAGGYKVVTDSDGWTILTADGLPSAHFEHTILINGNSPEILTVC
jgi:methionyl aminopeptidase